MIHRVVSGLVVVVVSGSVVLVSGWSGLLYSPGMMVSAFSSCTPGCTVLELSVPV